MNTIKTFDEFISEACVRPCKVAWEKVDSVDFQKTKSYVLKMKNKYNEDRYSAVTIPYFGLDVRLSKDNKQTYADFINKFEFAVNVEAYDDCWCKGTDGLKYSKFYLIRYPYTDMEKRLDPGRVEQFGGWKYKVELCLSAKYGFEVYNRGEMMGMDIIEWVELD